MMLVEDGELRLNEPVDRLLPELANRGVLRRIDAALDDTVPARRPVTVEDLLTFRCGHGLILAPPGRYPIQKAIADLGIFGPPDRALPLEGDAWMQRLSGLPLLAQPGEDWLYGTGSNIQGVLVARASGQSLSRGRPRLSTALPGWHQQSTTISRSRACCSPTAGIGDSPCSRPRQPRR